MSKIQDALSKIQRSMDTVEKTRPSKGDREPSDTSGSVKLGVVKPELDETGRVLIPRDGGFVAVNPDALRKEGYLAPQDQERFLADQYRIIKRPLLDNVSGRSAHQSDDANLIMVTSPLPGDGKTFNCINLALSLALEKDVTVLLVDADVAKPQVSDLFDVADKPGLIDVLNEDLDVDSITLRTDIPGLTLLPAGAHDANATELLASRRMGRLVHELSTSKPDRIVVFDSPPLLITSESRALSNFVGQIVMVVRAGKTPQRSVIEAIEKLDESKATNLVLNDSAAGEFGEKYGEYGYGYGYRNTRRTGTQSDGAEEKTKDS